MGTTAATGSQKLGIFGGPPHWCCSATSPPCPAWGQVLSITPGVREGLPQSPCWLRSAGRVFPAAGHELWLLPEVSWCLFLV